MINSYLEVNSNFSYSQSSYYIVHVSKMIIYVCNNSYKDAV